MIRSGGTTPDAELLQRLRNGDEQAFVELVQTYHMAMKHVAAAIIGTAQAEEAVQEAWLAAMRNLDGFEARSSLKTWLFTIVGNEAKSRLRKARREVSIEALALDGGFPPERFVADGHWSQPPSAWHDDSPEALLSQQDFERCLEKALASLPTAQRSALMMRDEEGLELEAICNILAVSASNARVLVHRARLKVYAMVEHFEETGRC